MGSLKWLEVMLYTLIPLGQLIARVLNFNGSLDKWYLMFPLLLIPPFSFFPLVMMKYGFIADGKGSNPVDKMMLLPIIAKFMIAIILPYIINKDNNTIVFALVSFILQIITILIANLSRRYYSCNSITPNSVGKATIDSFIAYGIGDIVSFMMQYIPVVNIFYTIISMIPVIGKFVDPIIWSICFSGTYVVINMFNQYDMEKFCSVPFFGNIQDRIPFVFSIFALIFVNIMNSITM